MQPLPPENPTNDPSTDITRWHGTIIFMGLAPQAPPTARGDVPSIVESSP